MTTIEMLRTGMQVEWPVMRMGGLGRPDYWLSDVITDQTVIRRTGKRVVAQTAYGIIGHTTLTQAEHSIREDMPVVVRS